MTATLTMAAASLFGGTNNNESENVPMSENGAVTQTVTGTAKGESYFEGTLDMPCPPLEDNRQLKKNEPSSS